MIESFRESGFTDTKTGHRFRRAVLEPAATSPFHELVESFLDSEIDIQNMAEEADLLR